MNTLKKIGLTALGTSLVAGSAFAGEITASGDAGYTWSSESIGGSAATPATGSATNDGVGYNHDITLSGSGELDNGWSVATTMILTEDSSLSSSNVKLTMGGLGSIVVGNGTGGTGASFDDATPRAYEENHDGMKTSTAIDNMGALLGNGGIDYYSPSFDLGGATASFMLNLTPEVSGTAVGEGGVSTSSVDRGSGQALGVNLSMGGISAGAYAASASADTVANDTAVTGNDMSDATDATWFVNYTTGPVSFGYQKGVIDRGIGAAAETATTGAKTVAAAGGDFEIEKMSIAFNVNDNLSISYEQEESEPKTQRKSTTQYTMESTGIQASYTMGGMTLGVAMNDHENASYTTNKDVKDTVFTVEMAF